MTWVNERERKVLLGLCLGTVEDSSYFPGVGRKTFDEMLRKGWIVKARCQTYDVDGYKITDEGRKVFQGI